MRTRTLALLSVLALAATTSTITGCAAGAEDQDDASGASSVTKFRTVWQDLKGLDGSGWTKLVGEVASDKIQDGISGDRLTFDWDVRAAAAAAKVSSLPGMSVFDLDALSTGLLQRFGDNDLSAQVNKLRRDRVQDGSYYLDAVSTVGLKAGKDWGIKGPSAANFTSTVSFGFDAGTTLESRVVVHAPADTLKDEAKTWLASVMNDRDYLLSKDAAKVDQMQPGEMWGLRGKGKLGGHLGIGVPLVVAAPLSIIFSAGASAELNGMLDVQVVKLENGQAVVDLGIEEGTIGAWSMGIGSTFGIPTDCNDSDGGAHALCMPNVGGVALKEVMPKLTQKLLNSYLTFQATTGGSKSKNRLSVLRLRFDFNAGSAADKVEARAAFARAIMFDARHAQTLYHQHMDDSKRAVTVEADLFRSMTTSVRYTTWNALGMRVYDSNDTAYTGTVGLKTPNDTKVVSMDIRNKRSGWFQTKHGFDRMGYAALSANGSEGNLVMNVVTSDTHIDDRGLITDNADAILLATGGRKASDALDAFGNGVQSKALPCGADDACVFRALGGSDQGSATQAFESSMLGQFKSLGTAGLDTQSGYPELMAEAARLRLSSQGLAFAPDTSGGPAVDFTFGVRLDDKGLTELMDPTKSDQFKARAYDYLVATTSINRALLAPVGSITKAQLLERFKGGTPAGLDDILYPSYQPLVDDLAQVFVDNAKKYQTVKAVERDAGTAMTRFGSRYVPVFVGIDFDTIKNLNANDKQITNAFSSTSQKNAEASVALFDALYDESHHKLARVTHLWAEQLVGYTLAQMVSPANRETSLDFRVSGSVDGRYKAAGLDRWVSRPPTVAGKVTRIALGSLDLEAVAKAD